jgi:sterol desaturase/sphingolipid hydroxylase (fatty acid hydroxylase superfamily)
MSHDIQSVLDFLQGQWINAARGFGITLGAIVVVGAIYYIVLTRATQDFSLTGMKEYILRAIIDDSPTQQAERKIYPLVLFVLIPLFSAVPTVLGAILGGDVATHLIHYFGQRPQLLYTGWATVASQAACLSLSAAFMGYWVHRGFHQIPLLWAFHRCHHSAESLTIFTNGRVHSLDLFACTLFIPVGASVLNGAMFYLTGTPLSPKSISAVFFFDTVCLTWSGALAHTHMRINLGWFNRIILSPVMHQIHHSAEIRHRDKNFTVGLGVFDWVFGTLYIPKKDEVWRVGLNDDEIGENNPHLRMRDFYFEPFRQAKMILTSRNNREMLSE